MLNIKINLQRTIQLLSIITITALASACSSDDASTSAKIADPNNCATPCLASAPILDVTTVRNDLGATIIMILPIAGNSADIDLTSSSFYLWPVDNSLGAGTLVAGSGAVIDTVANTITLNFLVPITSETGAYYPAIYIAVAPSPDPNDPGTLASNYEGYTLQTAISSVNYSFEEVIAGESSTYTSNGIFLGYTATDIVIPTVMLENPPVL